MPNAKDIDPSKMVKKILLLGQSGSGKTTQFLTLPGKKFIYLFDPNATLSLQGYDIDYEEFLSTELNLGLTSLSADTRSKKGIRPSLLGATVYNAWQDDFDKKVSQGFFDSYDVIGMDSFTTFSDLVMDGILAINGRGGQWPQQDDYGPQMLVLSNVFRTLTAFNKTLFVTGHIEVKQDGISKKIFQTPLMTGRLKVKLPLLFSEILFLEAMADMKGVISYTAQMRPDRNVPLIRTTKKDANFKEDITLNFSKPLEGQGLGRILR